MSEAAVARRRGSARAGRAARSASSPRRTALLSLVPAILLAGSLVLADRPRVVIVGPSASHPIVTRVRDELTLLGFDVHVEIDLETSDLASIAQRANARAAARIGAAPPMIDLWVAAGASPDVESLREPADGALLALRAVELLRAKLLPVPPIEGSPDASAAPPTARPAASAPPIAATAISPAKPRAPRPFNISAGPALMLSPGGVPAAVHVRVGAEWDPSPRVGLETMVFVPTAPSTVTAAEGAIDLRVLEFGGGIRGNLLDPGSDLGLALGLGLSAVLLAFEGRALPPWAADSGHRWAASPYGSISATYRFHPRVALRLDLVASLVRPEPVLRIAGRDVASFGQPAVFSSLGVEVRP